MKGLVVERGGTSTVAEVPQEACSHQIRSQHAQRAKHSQHVVQVCRDVRDRQMSVAAQGHVRRNSIVLYEGLQARQGAAWLVAQLRSYNHIVVITNAYNQACLQRVAAKSSAPANSCKHGENYVRRASSCSSAHLLAARGSKVHCVRQVQLRAHDACRRGVGESVAQWPLCDFKRMVVKQC